MAVLLRELETDSSSSSMGFKGTFSWINAAHLGGRKAISFTLECTNLLLEKEFDCAIFDGTGQRPPQIRRKVSLHPRKSFVFNYDTCGWDWCPGDYFAILGRKDKIVQRWDLDLQTYKPGECPDCHGTHKCIACNGTGQIMDIYSHTYNTCAKCKGTGVCQTCFVPTRQDAMSPGERYTDGLSSLAQESRQRKIAVLQKSISELQSKIEKVEWDLRIMQVRGRDVSSHSVYSAQLSLKYQYERQLLNYQYELQQLENQPD